ncbi:methyltransferase domain-containing protein [Candidatus Poribacteria bacterium]|nr:methyltransferase domain-containing protein [Candidatus Poribacteria bacterium]
MLATHWDTSAETYSVESEKISFYQITNRELIAAGQMQPGMTIVDLGCGAGLTTQIILASFRDRCTIYAVDLSEKMLQQARRAITSKSVHFIHASADDFSRYIPEGIDRVFCNAAFWHFPDDSAVLKEIRIVLKTTGRFLFNIPDQEFDFGDGKRSEMAQVVSACLKPPLRSESLRYSYATIQSLAIENGLCIIDFKIIEIDIHPEDVIRFYSIPHVGARRFPDISQEERREIFTKAFSVLSPNQFPKYRWAQFTLTPGVS